MDEKEGQDLIKGLSPEGLLSLCMGYVAGELKDHNIPPLIMQEFKEGLGQFMRSSIPDRNSKINSMAFAAMVIEELSRLMAPAIVAMAAAAVAIIPISEEGQKLLRREVEDSLLEMISKALKEKVLTSHIEYTNFYPPTKKG